MKYKALICLFILCFYIQGCSSIFYPLSDLNDGLSTLNGQNIEYSYSYLGIPENTSTIPNGYIYWWYTSFDISLPTQTYGNIYANSYSATTYNNNIHHYCIIKILTNENLVIIGNNVLGASYGCKEYTKHVQQLLKN